ncbi:hypothetical protein D3C80_1579360 [compost metagenome]
MVQRNRGVVAFDHLQRQLAVTALTRIGDNAFHQRFSQPFAAHFRSDGQRRYPAVQTTAANQRQRYRLLLVRDDNAVIQAKVFGTETTGEGVTINDEAHDVVFKTVAKDLRQLITAVAQR